MVSVLPLAGSKLNALYCPYCLRRRLFNEIIRKSYIETCKSGNLDAVLVRCPDCGLVLTAEIEIPPLLFPNLN